jgi:hypothetical protein
MSTRPASVVSVAEVVGVIATPPYRTPVIVRVVPVERTITTAAVADADPAWENVRSPVVVSTELVPDVPFVVGNRVAVSCAIAKCYSSHTM